MNGQVMNVFEADRGVSKKTNEPYGGQTRVQLMCQVDLQNGGTKYELQTLTVEDLTPYRSLVGHQVRIPVGCFADGGAIRYFVLKGATPERVPVPAASAAG